MAALDTVINLSPLLTSRTIIVTTFLLTRATLLTALVVLLILLARIAFLLASLLPTTLLGAAGILLVLLARILALSALLVTHLIVLVLISHFEDPLVPTWHNIKTRDLTSPFPARASRHRMCWAVERGDCVMRVATSDFHALKSRPRAAPCVASIRIGAPPIHSRSTMMLFHPDGRMTGRRPQFEGSASEISSPGRPSSIVISIPPIFAMKGPAGTLESG